MSEVIAQISLANLAPRHKPIDESVYVGKDILDLLTGSMYLDPLNVYREYIQNAADSIDEARNRNLDFPPGSQITLEFSQQDRTVKIRDFGWGVPASDFVRRLTTIGASGKRGTKQRGFRGVGRLSGLGFCQELIFRGRAEGDTKVSEIRWDGRVLREKMKDASFVGGLSELVAAAVTHTRLPAEGYPDRFFEVEMRKVQRLRNDLLLNEAAVKNYLSQIAPVPFSPEFSFGSAIQARLDEAGVARTVDISIVGDDVPIYHRANDSIPLNPRLSDKISEIDWMEYFGVDGELVALAWFAKHSYSGAIPRKLGLGGIRLRAGNIQVGDEDITAQLFTESRFVGWAIGDVHVVSQKILPNGRRDEFEVSVHYTQLQNQLSMTMKDITQHIRNLSIRRNRLKQVHTQLAMLGVWNEIQSAGGFNSMLAAAIQEVATDRLELARQEATKLRSDGVDRQVAEAQIAIAHTELQKSKAKVKAGSLEKRLSAAATPIKAALKTILMNASSPKKGMALAQEVLAAVAASQQKQ